MKRLDSLALILSLLALLASYWVGERIFEGIPHIEDEMAYVWQAEAIAGGHLTVPSPPEAKSFLVPFVVDYHGQRFGKYPLGWPAALAVGVYFGGRAWVNPLLAGLGVWLTYCLGKRVFNAWVGLLAAMLTLTSPFFLMNSGSLLSHPLGLALSLAFALGWIDAWEAGIPVTRQRLALFAAAASLGLLALTRPLTAVGVSLPFTLHGLYLFVRGEWPARRRLLAFVAIVLALSAIYPLWQLAVTGNARLNPYTLWWEYDTVGFGPEVGRATGGHSLRQAWINTRFSLTVGWHDFFGWPGFSWLFLPFGLLALWRRRLGKGLLVASIFPSLAAVYLTYWIGSWLFGPRYYYEGLFSLTLLSAAGIAFLAGWPVAPGENRQGHRDWRRWRAPAIAGLMALLLAMNLVFYTPPRLVSMYALYGVSRARQEPFQSVEARALAPALVIVHPKHWTEYGALLDLQHPFLDTPFIFVISRGRSADANVVSAFAERHVIHYYPDEPYEFYARPRTGQ